MHAPMENARRIHGEKQLKYFSSSNNHISMLEGGYVGLVLKNIVGLILVHTVDGRNPAPVDR